MSGLCRTIVDSPQAKEGGRREKFILLIDWQIIKLDWITNVQFILPLLCHPRRQRWRSSSLFVNGTSLRKFSLFSSSTSLSFFLLQVNDTFFLYSSFDVDGDSISWILILSSILITSSCWASESDQNRRSSLTQFPQCVIHSTANVAHKNRRRKRREKAAAAPGMNLYNSMTNKKKRRRRKKISKPFKLSFRLCERLFICSNWWIIDQ